VTTRSTRSPARISYRFDDVVVDRENFRVVKGGEARTLAPRAFDLLVFLVEHRGRVVEKQELFDEVWEGAFVTDNALTKAVKEIRQAIGDDASAPRYIETVPKRGYRFIAEVEPDAPAEEPRVAVATSSVAPPAPPRRAVPVIAAAVVLVLLATIGLFLLVGRGVKSPTAVVDAEALRMVQVTTWSGLDMFPDFSPDGNSVAFCSDRSGAFEVYVRQLAPGGREIQVTSDGQMNVEPAWSPDGATIAYHSQQRGGIWAVPAFGGIARRVSEFGSRPRWSPDGSSIAFQSDGLTDISSVAFGAMPPSTIWVVPAGGGAPREITSRGVPSGGHGSPAWSPDGKRLAFATYAGGEDALWTIPVDGGEAKRLTGGGALLFDPVWSPDGASIYYVAASIAKRNFGVWRIGVSSETGEAAGAPDKVADTGRQVSRHLAISPDGTKLAFSSVLITNDIWSVPVSAATGEAAGPPVALTSGTSFRKTCPVFSPDGEKVAYSSALIGSTVDIWLVGADGAGSTQVTAGPGMRGFPSWFPDGKRLAFLVKEDSPPELQVLDLEGGGAQSLLAWPRGIAFPRLSRDGSKVAFQTDEGGTINVWTSPVPVGEPKQLTFEHELAGWACWSPDGATIAVEIKRGNDTHIAVVPSGGGQLEQLTSDPGQSWTGSWSPNGDRIAFAGQRDGKWNIWWVSRGTRKQHQVTSYARPNVYVRAPDWSPKGDRIVYEYSEVTGNIWLLELR
jgi:Tol biopolymer transport system component/DNA-binding winged helix-turn-helix (wHTH) protein